MAQDTVPLSVKSVDSIDLARYAGRWYEVARFPNRFQNQCVAATTADYELLPNGEVRVTNACRKSDGTISRAEGKAKLARRNGPTSQLKVRFAPRILSFLPMVWGDYWVLDLTAEYTAALVGDPSRKYLWVLSRTPVLDDEVYQRLVESAKAQGFDVSRLERSPS
ncbi:MAG: lipocalin family protein [Gemmatimonadota bacterium]